jgi:O-6-methylguanine DNA methyltransferase
MYKNHLGFYPYSGNITKLFKKELSGYKTSSGAVQFPKNKPLPKTLIAKLLQARLEEIANNTLYYYTCPKPLGYLEIILDTTGRVKTAVFVEKKGSGKTLPDTLRTALDSYFKSRKNIPSNLVSKKLKGTDFQKSIWTVISKAPFGKTITYTDMAKKVGSENAVRAAGTACGKNPVALFIPCHRVVRKEGEDYGYSWGIERKKWLLDFEK